MKQINKLIIYLIIAFFSVQANGMHLYEVENYMKDGVVIKQSESTRIYTTEEMIHLEDILLKVYRIVDWDVMWPSYKEDGSTMKKLADFRDYLNYEFGRIDGFHARMKGKSINVDFYVKQDGSVVCQSIKTYDYDLLKYTSPYAIKSMIKKVCEYKFKEASVRNKYCLYLHAVVNIH